MKDPKAKTTLGNPIKHTVVISIGSNFHAEKNIIAALDILASYYQPLKISPVYRSLAKQKENGTHLIPIEHTIYLNLIVSFQTDESILDCQKTLKKIEVQQHRRYDSTEVSCDLDLLIFNEKSGIFDGINLPHKDIAECDYVLRPLADLLPNDLHPTLQISYSALWQSFTEDSSLEPVDFCWNGQLISTKPTILPL